MFEVTITREQREILKTVDHTHLDPLSTWEQIQTLCQEGLLYHVASVCIPPLYVDRAARFLEGQLPVCTVIGFPNGYNTLQTKLSEAREAIANGAKEIDAVISLGNVKSGHFDAVRDEIRTMREVCEGMILKVIIETCFLTTQEKIRMCEIVTQEQADFIKTSTGFGTGGATLEDIILFGNHIGPNVRIKAAGGIATMEDARVFLDAGASRLGTSRIVKLIQKKQTEGYASR